MTWEKKIAWVTGASSGIGEALARSLSARGAEVIISGRRTGALEALQKALPGPSMVLPFDVTDIAALPAHAESALAWRGHIDLLVNNAGVSQRSLALDTSLDVYRTIMEVDFFAPVRLTQLLLPSMVQRRSGHIAAVSSLAGKFGTPLRTAYSAAKHAIVGYCEALRTEVEIPHGLKVSTILPGSVRTLVGMNALKGDGTVRGASDDHIENGMDPHVAGEMIADALAQGRREIVIAEGPELAAAGLYASDPERLFDLLSQEGARLAALRAEQGVDFRT